ncbi:hypothetical protein [Halobacillus yeomjeoni]|uniref:Uncharacterized protein n=1 Tax=Halobacillus yeomjeoni TaxID=311194 RepID=A0A931HXR2_9BACI|nr:hypothetical protein [Halobacillus yeomjeoni]MBH0231369.1 hypothetical protein [Halobacillus yeomjeoni]
MNKKMLSTLIFAWIPLILLIVIYPISDYFLEGKEVSSMPSPFKDAPPVHLPGEWYFNISAIKGEKTEIQVPLFDLSEENVLAEADFHIDDFYIGEVEDVTLRSNYSTPDYGAYILKFDISSPDIGKHSIEGLKLTVQTPSREYEMIMGDMDVEILDRSLEGELSSQEEVLTHRTYTKQSEYIYKQKITAPEEGVNLEQISVSNNEKVSITESLQTEDDEEENIRLSANVDLGSYKFVYLVPSLVYEKNGMRHHSILQPNIYRPRLGNDFLIKNLKNKNDHK